jgi:hypothetical protein
MMGAGEWFEWMRLSCLRSPPDAAQSPTPLMWSLADSGACLYVYAPLGRMATHQTCHLLRACVLGPSIICHSRLWRLGNAADFESSER